MPAPAGPRIALRSTMRGGAAQRAGWMRHAVCSKYDPHKWDDDSGPDALGSIRVCEQCPVMAQCRAYALRLMVELPSGQSLPGVWGGTTHTQRLRLLRRRAG
jgi:hypothetical protein